MNSPMTGAEVAAIPFEERQYTCQQCGKESSEGPRFRMIKFLGIAFVLCLDCIVGPDALAEVERAAAEKALTEFADDYNDIYTGSEMIMQLAPADYWRGADDAVQHAIAKLRVRAATYRREEA